MPALDVAVPDRSSWSPSSSIIDGASASSSLEQLRARSGRAEARRSVNSSVSAMRPTRSTCFDHRELRLDGLAVGVLAVPEDVPDHLEDVRERRQREDEHHLALGCPGAWTKASARVSEVLEQVAVEERLALLAEPEHRVELGAGLGRHHRPQELDVAGRHLHVDHEVGAREREEDVELRPARAGWRRARAALPSCRTGTTNGSSRVAVDDRADARRRPCCGRRRELRTWTWWFGSRCFHSAAAVLVERAHELVEVARRGRRTGVASRSRAKTCAERRLEVGAGGVVAAVDRRVGVDVLGRDRRADEDQVVVEVAAVEDRVERPS